MASLDLAEAAIVDAFQFPLQLADALADQPSVDFQLLLAGTARADAADRPGGRSPPGAGHRIQVRPHPRQPWVRILQLGQFDLKLGLLGLGPRRENVEDQLAAVEHLGLSDLLQLADLGRGQIVVENDHVGFETSDPLGELKGLALADVGRRIDRTDALLKPVSNNGPGTLGESGQLGQIIGSVRSQQVCGHQDGTFFSDFQRLAKLFQRLAYLPRILPEYHVWGAFFKPSQGPRGEFRTADASDQAPSQVHNPPKKRFVSAFSP